MRILVLNCGSSSLKFELVSFEPDAVHRVTDGTVADIGRGASASTRSAGRADDHGAVDVADHGAAARWALRWLRDSGVLGGAAPDGVGHRVVHGGPRLFAPTVIDDNVIREITAAGDLAPLHNHAALQAITAARESLGDAVPMVAVFDTAFHHGLPERASRYAIPPETADAHGIRRYGFHGLAHRYMTERCASLLNRPAADLRLVTMHLGGGCSAAAVRGGKSVDTSMGFTPLEGLVMGTRSGDIDPSVLRYLCEHGGMTVAEADDWLNHRCGLRGVSGVSADVRELLRLESQGHAHAALALDLFCYRLRKYLGAYLAVLGGADAVVFAGGIGEHSPVVRARACRDMEWCGLRIDEHANRTLTGAEGEFTAAGSQVRAFVVPVDEEILIAEDTWDLLRR